ncbi:unnamed protein product, partial [Mesorhabditis belari]|uniref:CHK kinase-like domain-containing protein n=1 Tax=Mesorhabditis belari TaxID=2138241 RepID=A0AAF3F839_9BILA
MGCGASVEDSSVSASPTPNHSNDRHNRLSVVSLGLPGQDEDAMSASSVPSMEPPPTMPSTGFGGEEEKICNTELRIKWIVRKLTEHFPIHEEPQWIAERLNRKTSTEIESSTVIRITLAWESEDPRLPRSVVLKIPLAKEAREDEKGRFYYTLFKRECNAFDWLQHVKDFSTPIIYHIKKHGNEDGGGCIIMEDLGERAQQQDEKNGLGIENVGDLLFQLARLHAQSWRDKQWTTMIADLPVSFFSNEAGSFADVLEYFTTKGADPMRLKKIEKFFAASYLENTVNESCDELKVAKVLVHGEPFSSNIFVDIVDTDHHPIAGIVDWTSCHAGCFGEDLAKAICWNLNPRERATQTSQLLQAYHYQLVLQSGNASITSEQVRAAYEKFVPVATVSFVHKVMVLRGKSEPDALIERANSLINQVYNTVRINEELIDDDKMNNNNWTS